MYNHRTVQQQKFLDRIRVQLGRYRFFGFWLVLFGLAGCNLIQFVPTNQASSSTESIIFVTVTPEPPVNTAPVADDQSVTTTKNNEVAVTLTASDGEDDPLTFAVETQPSNGALSGTAPNLTYTPDRRYLGSDSFTFPSSVAMSPSRPPKDLVADIIWCGWLGVMPLRYFS